MLGSEQGGEWFSPSVASDPVALLLDDTQHLTDTLGKLNTLRKEGQLCDVTMQVGRASFPAHRAVLACTCGHLMELFTEDQECHARTHFKLPPHVNLDAFTIILNYAYTSRLEVPKEHIISVYRTAILLKVPRVAQACSEYLAKNLTSANCLAIRGFANSTCHGELTAATDAFIQENIGDLMASEAFAILPSMLFDIMGVTDEELEESGEANVAQLVVTWLEAALQEQKFYTFTENPHVLYLTGDNELRDCLNLPEDRSTERMRTQSERELVDKLHSSDVVQDYVKLSKRKQLPAVKGCKPHRERTNQNQGHGVKGHKRQSSLEKLNVAHQEWKLIATHMVKENTCVCVAMLDETLTVIQLKFRPYPTLEPETEATQDGGALSSGKSSPISSPRHSVVMEKHVSLTPLAALSQGRCSAGAAVVKGHLLVVGGYDRGECLDTVECYTPASNTWTQLTPMTTPRGRFDMAQVGDQLYACGGSNGSRDLRSAEVYDWATSKWSRLPDMRHERSWPGVAALKNKVFVIGGASGATGLKSCEMYDPLTDKWSPIADLNMGRSQAGVCTLGGRIYAVGGCDAWNCTNTVEMYDPDADEWIQMPSMLTQRRGAGVAVFKGELYVVGGSDGQCLLSAVEKFDPVTQQWSHGPALSVSRANASVAVLNDRMYAVGGFSGKQFLDSMECLVAERREWNCFAAKLHSGHSESSGESASELDSDSNQRTDDSRRAPPQDPKAMSVPGKQDGDSTKIMPANSTTVMNKKNDNDTAKTVPVQNNTVTNGDKIGNSGEMRKLNEKEDNNKIAEKLKNCQIATKEGCVPDNAVKGHVIVNGHNVTNGHANGLVKIT